MVATNDIKKNSKKRQIMT